MKHILGIEDFNHYLISLDVLKNISEHNKVLASGPQKRIKILYTNLQGEFEPMFGFKTYYSHPINNASLLNEVKMNVYDHLGYRVIVSNCALDNTFFGKYEIEDNTQWGGFKKAQKYLLPKEVLVNEEGLTDASIFIQELGDGGLFNIKNPLVLLLNPKTKKVSIQLKELIKNNKKEVIQQMISKSYGSFHSMNSVVGNYFMTSFLCDTKNHWDSLVFLDTNYVKEQEGAFKLPYLLELILKQIASFAWLNYISSEISIIDTKIVNARYGLYDGQQDDLNNKRLESINIASYYQCLKHDHEDVVYDIETNDSQLQFFLAESAIPHEDTRDQIYYSFTRELENKVSKFKQEIKLKLEKVGVKVAENKDLYQSIYDYNLQVKYQKVQEESRNLQSSMNRLTRYIFVLTVVTTLVTLLSLIEYAPIIRGILKDVLEYFYTATISLLS